MLYELCDMGEWKTKEVLLKELKDNGIEMSERVFRKSIKNNNALYYEDKASKFIAHSNKGYIATTDENILIRCAKDFRKRAIDQLVETSRIYKKLKMKGNLKLVINEDNLLVVEE
jgi:hypothetical protein